MQARPRSVENRVAEWLSLHFARLGLPPVERIPVLGRAGPDISMNAMKLVVDVKSRIEVPRALFFPLLSPFCFGEMTAARLCCLPALWEEAPGELPALDFRSKTVRGYLDHMEQWTRAHAPGGISCVVLHRPEIPVGNSVAIIYSTSRRRLIEYARTNGNHHVCAE